MKKIHFNFRFLLCLLTLLTSTMQIKAQSNVPKVTCIYCGGTGRAGYIQCLFCSGTGLMVDPNYQNQKAAEYGKSLGLCIRGESALANGLYSDAYNAFSEAAELGNAKAMFFVGVCFELGMGVNVDQELAKECYSLGSKYGSIDAKQAIQRINKNGYWPATDQTRKNFSNFVMYQHRIIGNSMIINNNSNNSDNSNTRDYGACPNCHGTGRCTMCAGRGAWKGNDGTYYDCRMCHGGGQCPSCHGSGKLR